MIAVLDCPMSNASHSSLTGCIDALDTQNASPRPDNDPGAEFPFNAVSSAGKEPPGVFKDRWRESVEKTIFYGPLRPGEKMQNIWSRVG
jgi:hypothetical protein